MVTHHGAKEPEWENDLGPNRVIKVRPMLPRLP